MTLQSRIVERLLHLPPAATRNVRVLRKQRIRTPDGVELLADVYSPRRVRNAPTILVRTPYGRGGMVSRLTSRTFAERGYHVVIATCRGTDGSGGTFDPFLDDQKDGLATLDWIEEQPWYNGKLLMFGPSYLGHVQLALAPDAGDRITALLPMITTSGFRDNWYNGDSYELAGLVAWTARMVTLENRHPLIADLLELRGDKRAQKAMRHLPLSEVDNLATGKTVGWFQSWLVANGTKDPYWGPEREHRDRIGEIAVPTLLFGGWYDVLLPGQLDDYAAMRAAGRQPYLTIGPWLHVSTDMFAAGVREALVWFRAHVTGNLRDIRKDPVRLYVQGAEEWRDYPDYPPPGTTEQSWYLRPNGGLGPEAVDGPPDHFRYDPSDPTPTVGGPLLDPGTGGRKDNTELEARPDVVLHTSDPLVEPVEVIGPVPARIRLTTSSPYADVFVRLCDVDPQGRSVNVCDGLQRINPDDFPADASGVRDVNVRLWPTGYRFQTGHRLRVQVSGGSFPRYARNTGTGEPLGAATRTVPVDYDILPSSTITLPLQTAGR
jgi:putative CocE/NonD family hydrolase